MKKSNKKGFTIVELVIVIAVIAILAAVLIPTFSSLVKKANLSADKQAVREMNEALARWEAQNGYSKCATIDDVMRVLGEAGYNTDDWACLTDGYKVYWYENDNRMVLYNASTHQLEYPSEYSADLFTNNESLFHPYNENHIKALEIDFKFGNQTASSTGTSISSNSSVSDMGSLVSGSESDKEFQATAIRSAVGAIQNNSALQAALGVESNKTVNVYASSQKKSGSGSTYASMQCMAVKGTDSNIKLKSYEDNTLKANVIYLSINKTSSSSETEIANAQTQLGTYVYDIFANINEGKLEEDINIIIEAGTVLSCNENNREWQPVKKFSGYFGTPDGTVTINGAKLSHNTPYSLTTYFDGSSSKYFLTGFFGSVYGNSTIENVTFENITIDKPANNYTLQGLEISNKSNSRNTIGIIGGIIDARSDKKLDESEAKKLGLPTKATKASLEAAAESKGATKHLNDKKEWNGNWDYKNTTVPQLAKGMTDKKVQAVTGYYYCAYAPMEIEGFTLKQEVDTEYCNEYTKNGITYVCGNANVDLDGNIVFEWYIKEGNHKTEKIGVTLRNITVKDTVTITGAGCVGGLVGYIGSSSTCGATFIRNDSYVKMEKCKVSAKVLSADTFKDNNGYGLAGGLVSFMCRSGGCKLTVKDCTFDGSVDGNTAIGGFMGFSPRANIVFEGTNDFSDAKINRNGTGRFVFALGSSQSSIYDSVVNKGTIKYTANLNRKINLDSKNNSFYSGVEGYNDKNKSSVENVCAYWNLNRETDKFKETRPILNNINNSKGTLTEVK